MGGNMEVFICPRCGQQTMIKQTTAGEEYILVCSSCGLQFPSLPGDYCQGIV
jgi:transcription elongation factor Elf1